MKYLTLALLYSALYGQTVTPPSGSSVSGGAVGGASSLITAGDIVIVASSGVVGQTATPSVSSLTVGSGGPTCTPGTGGALCLSEGTVPSVGAAAGVDVIYSDSTQHGFLASFNNGSYLPLVQGPASATSGHLATFSGTNGGLLMDGGAVPSITGLVGGSANLSTGGNPGPVPYTSSAGTLSQDATNFCWDATNHRLGLGTCSPAKQLDVVGATALEGVTAIGGTAQIGDAKLTLTYAGASSDGMAFYNTSASGRQWYLGDEAGSSAGAFALYDKTGSAIRWQVSSTGVFSAGLYATLTNCSSAASPAACGAAVAGAVAIPTGVTSVALTVNTTAVTANSEILVLSDDSLTIASTTCNSTLATLVGGIAVTARTPGTSFTITYNGTIATNPLCVSYWIVN